MKGPQKLIEGDGTASAFARELLREGRVEVLPAPAKAALWKSIAAQAPGALAAPAGAAAAGAAKGMTVTGMIALKGTLAAVALGGAIWGGHHVVSGSAGRRAFAPPVVVPSVKANVELARASPPPAATLPGAATPTHEPARPRRPARATVARPGGDAAVSAPASSRLGEESQLVLEAREGLRSGRASLVLRQLEEARGRFPGGTLAQEREALTIEALWRSGQTASARRRAEAFARTYPGSPHAARLEQLTSR
jgi:hypothetical protein